MKLNNTEMILAAVLAILLAVRCSTLKFFELNSTGTEETETAEEIETTEATEIVEGEEVHYKRAYDKLMAKQAEKPELTETQVRWSTYWPLFSYLIAEGSIFLIIMAIVAYKSS